MVLFVLILVNPLFNLLSESSGWNVQKDFKEREDLGNGDPCPGGTSRK